MNKKPWLSDFAGNSTKYINELCKFIWTVEVDLENGNLLHLTGDYAVLGYWKQTCMYYYLLQSMLTFICIENLYGQW